tara:strand:- start:432 stop:779 length:348 start_codon:yes stop_codon:yes gene_type:complete
MKKNKNKKGEKMKTEKKLYHTNYNPIELWIWQNKKYLGSLVKNSFLSLYGARNSKWRYDFETGEFVWNQFKQVDKHEWSKEAVAKRTTAIKLLKGPMLISFQKKLEEYKNEKGVA